MFVTHHPFLQGTVFMRSQIPVLPFFFLWLVSQETRREILAKVRSMRSSYEAIWILRPRHWRLLELSCLLAALGKFHEFSFWNVWNVEMFLSIVQHFNLFLWWYETLSVVSVAYFIFPQLTRSGFCCLQRKKSIRWGNTKERGS